jgi:hypothetical protein
MNEMKTRIEPNPSDSRRPYTHLEPIVDALIEAGNESMYEKTFFLDKDGWRCDLKKSIDFDLVRERFALPRSVSLSEEHNSILCENTWVEIQGHGQ